MAFTIATDLPVWKNRYVFHLGDVVKKLRVQRDWTLEELAEQSAVNKGTLSGIERGEGNPRRDTLERIASALGTTVGALYAASLGDKKNVIVDKHSAASDADLLDEDVTSYKRDDIPVIQEGEASPNGLAWDAGDPLAAEVERMSRPYDFREQGAYAVVLRGDSMEPILKRGMRLIVSVTKPISDGDVAYVQLKNNERLVKIATRVTDGWLLTSANPAHAPRQVNIDEIEHIHKVAWVRFLK